MLAKKVDWFRMEEILGKGGMGEVYRAFDEKLERWVAIKVIRPGDLEDQTARSRFLREAKTAAQLTHPAIVRIYHVLESDEQDYIVMELIEGHSLREEVRGAPLDLERVVHLAREIAEGLAAAHAKGIVHRDLKLENVNVTPAGRAKILDFGLAKRLDHGTTDLSGAGAILGTLHCMSPEQAQGREVDHRTDLFSFGVLLYQLLTGRAPFQTRSARETLAKICLHRQAPAHELNPRIPRALSALIDNLLEKDRNHRPQSASEVATALADFARKPLEGGQTDRRVREADSSALTETLPQRRSPLPTPKPSSPRQVQLPATPASSGAKIPILYVDDEKSNLVLFERVFEEVYDIRTAQSAREAIDVLRRQPVHLVITDQRMPGMTGVQLLEVIQGEFPDIVRMILTAYSDVDAVIKAINTGRVYQYIKEGARTPRHRRPAHARDDRRAAAGSPHR